MTKPEISSGKQILRAVSAGRWEEAEEALKEIHRLGSPLWRDFLYSAITLASSSSYNSKHSQHHHVGVNEAETVCILHSIAIFSDLHTTSALADPLIRFFGSLLCLLDANVIFCQIQQPTNFTWQTIIYAHSTSSHHSNVLELYKQYLLHGLPPCKHVLSSVLKACAAIGAPCDGMFVHDLIVRNSFDSDTILGSGLVDMYAKCGNLHEARFTFEFLSNRNEVTWNSMIAGYTQFGHYLSAFHLLEQMQGQGLKPGKVTFLCMLRLCNANLRSTLSWGRKLHDFIIREQLETDLALTTALVDMYSKRGSLEEATFIFQGISCKNALSWGVMICGYAQHDHGHLALEMFYKMEQAGFSADEVLLSSILKGFSGKEYVECGMTIHDKIIIYGLDTDVILGTAVIDMYVKCGSLDSATKVFNVLPDRNTITWTTLISGYFQHGHHSVVLKLLEEMLNEGIEPDDITFLTVLQACCNVATSNAITIGRFVHCQLIQIGVETASNISSTLITMYASFGSLEDTLKLCGFGVVDKWTKTISVYAHLDKDEMVLMLYDRMQDEGLCLGVDGLMKVLKSCGRLGDKLTGKKIHEYIINTRQVLDVSLCNSLIDMYVKCGDLEEAFFVFSAMPTRDVASWSNMISGYSQHGYGSLALLLLDKMLNEGLEPDNITLSCALKACTSTGSLHQGMIVHDWFLRRGLTIDLVAGNILVDLYARCGNLHDAYKILSSLPDRNNVSWNSMISACADNGFHNLAANCLLAMQDSGLQPCAATYNSMFTACSRSGEVEECWRYLNSMIYEHQILPTAEHLNCMLDILGRAGFLSQAEELLQIGPAKPNFITWTSLLTAYRFHVNGKNTSDSFYQGETSSK